MKDYWNTLNDRERSLVIFAGILCIIYLFYIFLYSPLITAKNNKQLELIDKEATLTWMEQVRNVDKSSKSLTTLSNANLLSVLGTQLKTTTFSHFSFQLEQMGSGDIQLSFNEVPYNAFIKWLWTLSGQYLFNIKQVTIEKATLPGLVKVMLVLSV